MLKDSRDGRRDKPGGALASSIVPRVFESWATKVVANCGLPDATTPGQVREAIDWIAYTIAKTTEAVFRVPLRAETRRVLGELEARGVTLAGRST